MSKKIYKKNILPKICPIEITGTDMDGDMLGSPTRIVVGIKSPKIYIQPERHDKYPLKIGDRILARLTPNDDKSYSAKKIRKISQTPQEILGVIKYVKGKYYLQSIEKKKNKAITININDLNGACSEDFVSAEIVTSRNSRNVRARIINRFNSTNSNNRISEITIKQFSIPNNFSAEISDLSFTLTPFHHKGREDLLNIPLITIDGEDAKDFDDAVWAEPDSNPENLGGWHLIVAIADVAWYVRPGGQIDVEAKNRGNSVYLPDIVMPMLPENLSNNLCSLIVPILFLGIPSNHVTIIILLISLTLSQN